MIKVLCVVGTRPEALKMIPVIYALQQSSEFECRIIATAQHRDMLDQVFNLFDIRADIDLDIMRDNQTLNDLAGRMLIALQDVLVQEKPQAIIAQGDTTTVLAAALSAFHHRIPFGHVEAGLRTGDLDNPFPEEMNRVLASRLTQWHFAPTEIARDNLLQEGISAEQIFLTGNTIVDMVRLVNAKNYAPSLQLDASKRLILVTAHRRENFGAPLREIFQAIKKIADTNTDIQIVYPVHPNPNVAPLAHEILADHPRILLCEPLDYIAFLNLMKQTYLILSDSGGIQEEAIALGKPLLLLREQTERPEGVMLGGVKMVGHEFDAIVNMAQAFLTQPEIYKAAATCSSPYGDGYAADKIVQVLEGYFSRVAMPENA